MESALEAVRFTTYDNIELAANLYLPGPRDAWAPGIIVCHGFGSCKENYADFGERASAMGFAVLAMDLRGHGDSQGVVDENIFNDVAAALLYLQSRPEANPTSISIRGASMGGWLAIHTAAHLIDIAPVVAYCPITETLLTILMEEVSMVQRGHGSSVLPSTLPRVDVNSVAKLLHRLDITRAARRLSPRPLLLVHCEGDEVVPSHLSRRIYDAAAEPKSLWLLPEGDHHFAQHDPDTDKRVLEWVKTSRVESEV
jgi:alpha-beta hydrolase superfamily lysophospholipase